jgi:hypothetical protein
MNRPSQLKVDWLELEQGLRSELQRAKMQTDTRDLAQILQAISDLLGRCTGRGFELDDDWYMQFEPKFGEAHDSKGY